MPIYNIVLVVQKGKKKVRQPFSRIEALSPHLARDELFKQHPGLEGREDIILEIQQQGEPDKPPYPRVTLSAIKDEELHKQLKKDVGKAAQRTARKTKRAS